MLDIKAVTTWMEDNVQGVSGDFQAEQFTQGQSNPTYLLRGKPRNYVLRRKPSGRLLKSAHAIDREFKVQKLLAKTNVPVAGMVAYCEDMSVIGAEFYIMEHVRGRNFVDPRMPLSNLPERIAIYDQMNEVLAAIHDVDLAGTGLADYGPSGHYYQRQLDRWTKQYRASETESITAMEDLIRWLGDTMPEDDGVRSLVHGDYRMDNLLFAPHGPACVAVLDWELSTIGHPFADLSGLIMQWQMPTGEEGRGLAGEDRASLGIPSDEAFVEAYCKRRGLAGIDGFGFYVAFAFFRMAAILQGVKKRALDGNASNPNYGLRMGALVPEFAIQGMAWTRD